MIEVKNSTLTAAEGLDQCRQFLMGLAPKGDSREIWIKQGHESIYRATWDEAGNLSGILTALTDKDDPGSRIDKGKPYPNLLKHLSDRCQREDGGVFFIPTQPQGLPTADCVDSTDDIGIELDHLPVNEQIALYQEFTQTTGLEFASLLTSGGASVHAHIKLDHHAEASGMEFWRRLAVIAFNSDPVTVRIHQPMRLPGFYRKEKGRYQELLSTSHQRYGFARLMEGFKAWFSYKGWDCPNDISSQWWSEVWHPLYRSTNLGTPASKLRSTAQYLAEGQTAYLARRKRESAAKPAQLARNGSSDDIGEMVRRANDGAGVGDFEGVDWDGGSGHYRGQCPFHTGKTGNSAWLSDQGGTLKFHCCGCTDDNPRDLFEYFTARNGLTSISDNGGLKGKDWVEAAKAFLNGRGYTVPDRPADRTVKKRDLAKEFMEEPQAVSKIESLESEFEEVRAKYSQAQDRVEMLTVEWEGAEGERKKELREQLRNAKDILKSLGSTRYATRVQLNKALTPVKLEGEAETGFAKDLLVIKERIAHRLSYDVLRKRVLLDGQQADHNSACLWLTNVTGHMNWNKSDNTLSLVILDLAKENEFCPVKKYLESLPSVAHTYLDQCVPYIFGIDQPYVVAAFRAQMIGSVRRIYEPGCYHRLMPLIYGGQKVGKSNLVQALYGEFFSEGDLPMRDKDGCLLVQRCWAHEVAECDKLFRTREASTLKAFVSQKVDHFRAPYARALEDHPRRSVLWGTTNQKTLFTDSTGNTRYPVIALPDGWKIPFMWVQENRDLIWAAALDGYKSGFLNDIPDELEADMAEACLDFQDRDALFEPLENWLANQFDSFTLMEVGKGLGFSEESFSKADQNRVTALLRSMGYDNRRITYVGKQVRRWAHYGKS